MNTSFSFTRIKYLLMRYFKENWKKDVLMGLILFGVSLLSDREGDFILFIISVFFVLYSGRVFSNLKYKDNAFHYLTIPASTLERVVTNIFLIHIYYIIYVWVLVSLGALLRGCIYPNFIQNLGINEVFSSRSFVIFDIWDYLVLICLQAIFMFGSVYFKKNAIAKTLLSIAGFGLLISFIIILLSTDMFNNTTGLVLHSRLSINFLWGGLYLPKIICVASTFFFWVLTYFRLKETEV